MTREDLQPLIIAALKANGGRARVYQVCKYVWDNHEDQIRLSGKLLYTWQYDIRWAAQLLRDAGILKPAHGDRTKPWELA
jgi:hypothetical protein